MIEFSPVKLRSLDPLPAPTVGSTWLSSQRRVWGHIVIDETGGPRLRQDRLRSRDDRNFLEFKNFKGDFRRSKP